MNTAARRNVSNRVASSLNRRMSEAAITASRQFVTKSASTNESGHPVGSSAARCAGSAASRKSHQRRGADSNRAAVSIEFGGQRTDGVVGGKRRMRPRLAPT